MATSESFDKPTTHDSLVTLVTAGSIDDGKSTLIGRILLDSGNLLEDQVASLRKDSDKLMLADITDGLKAEREQGITIDVAYRSFQYGQRRYLLADSPGHEQYTRNMVTGASTANGAILILDALAGVKEQTRRHLTILSLLQVPKVFVAINKMDLINFSESRYTAVCEELLDFASRLEIHHLRFTPVSALNGDNILRRSEETAWYTGGSLLEILEETYFDTERNLIDVRLPVQMAIRKPGGGRCYAGQLESGVLRKGDEVMVLPSKQQTKVKAISIPLPNSLGGEVNEIFAPMAVTVSLEDELDVARGDLIVKSRNVPPGRQQLEATLVWLQEASLKVGQRYILRHGTREVRALVKAVQYELNIATLRSKDSSTLSLNQIGRVSLECTAPIYADSYRLNRENGHFILIDPETFQTAAAGIVLERIVAAEAKGDVEPAKGETIWFTGLSGSGKSTIAAALVKNLRAEGQSVVHLDGDVLRDGLCQDLGFSAEDRNENLRRAAEVAKILTQSGVTVVASFISPYEKSREMIRELIGKDNFSLVYLSTPLATCENRDPKGLYKRARTGEIADFTGVSAPFEVPKSPDLVVDSSSLSVQECLHIIRNES